MAKIKNPVLPGFHPDPSILYNNGWFYIANSTFEWFGGVQLSRSKDLNVWEPVGQALTRLSQLNMKGNPPSGGIWAPCLSWSDNQFWLIFTDVKTWSNDPFKDTHNYLATAPFVEGPWSEPVYLNSSGFDPSLFHDSDGKKWLVNMEWDYRKPGVKKFTGILLQEYNHTKKQLVGPIYTIWEGSDIGIVEGPHLYKKDGWYYLVCAEGGTEYGHAVSVARSRNITGPYEIHPHNPLCTSRDNSALYLQKAGHGSWCKGPGDTWFLAFLVGRPLPGKRRCVLGRETAIAPLVWKDDWPYLANGKNNPPEQFTVPWEVEQRKEVNALYTFDTSFAIERFKKDFMTLRVPLEEDRCSFTARSGWLRLRGAESPVSRHDQTLIARRQEAFSFIAETAIEFNCTSFQEMAGLIYRYDENNWYYLRISWDEAAEKRTLGILAMNAGKFSMPLSQEVVLTDGILYLKLDVNFSNAQFYYSYDQKQWYAIGPVLDASILSDEYDGLGFTGAFVGISCQDMKKRNSTADFLFFHYKEISNGNHL